MLKGELLESQSWLRCPPTCAGQDVTPNSNLAGAVLILYLNLLTHNCARKPFAQTIGTALFTTDATRFRTRQWPTVLSSQIPTIPQSFSLAHRMLALFIIYSFLYPLMESSSEVHFCWRLQLCVWKKTLWVSNRTQLEVTCSASSGTLV